MMKNLLKKTIFYHVYIFLIIRIRRWLRLHKGSITVVEGIPLSIARCSPYMRNVILDGWYERPERQLCMKYITASDTVVELGSAIGFLALFCIKKIRVARYCMVEANPETIEILKENFVLNQLDPSILQYAVSANDGIAHLDISGEFWANSLVASPPSSQGTLLTVQTRTLASVLREIDFIPKVLIIDIEGSEQDIDPGSLPSDIEVIIIETHAFSIGIQKTQHLLARFDFCGFRAVDQMDNTYCLLRGKRLTDHTTGHSGPHAS